MLKISRGWQKLKNLIHGKINPRKISYIKLYLQLSISETIPVFFPNYRFTSVEVIVFLISSWYGRNYLNSLTIEDVFIQVSSPLNSKLSFEKTNTKQVQYVI